MPASSHSTEIGPRVADRVQHPEHVFPRDLPAPRGDEVPARGGGRPRAGASRGGRCGRLAACGPPCSPRGRSGLAYAARNATGSRSCQTKWLGSKFRPNAGRLPTASSAAGWSRSHRRSRSGGPRARSGPPRRRTRPGSGSSAGRSPRSPRSIISGGTGGNIATVCQIDEPVKPDHGVHPERGRGPRGVGQLGGGPLPDPFRLPVAPDPGGQDALVPLVDRDGRRPPGRSGGWRWPSSAGRTWPAARAGPPGSRPRAAPGPPRSGHPSRPAPGRRSPSRGPAGPPRPAAGRPIGR